MPKSKAAKANKRKKNRERLARREAERHAAQQICPEHGQMLFRHTQYGGLWVCEAPGCSVKCWEGGNSTPADDETRAARIKAHAAFDPLWLVPQMIAEVARSRNLFVKLWLSGVFQERPWRYESEIAEGGYSPAVVCNILERMLRDTPEVCFISLPDFDPAHDQAASGLYSYILGEWKTKGGTVL